MSTRPRAGRDPSIARGGTVICTIVSKNYLAHARTLMRSLRAHHDDVHLVTLLVDRIDGFFEPEREPFHALLASQLGIRNWAHLSMKYEITELNTAVKPYLLELLFDRFGARKVIYFDPDIVVYSRLDELLALLDRHQVVLTPHILAPLDDDRSPGELDFLRVGSYNLGFIGMSNRGRWRDLLRWWQQKLYSECTREIDRGLFVDQHWIDLVPSLFEGVHVLRDPGYNLAYWNFKTRALDRDGQAYEVDGRPLVFFHFSGFSYDDIERVSKHQNRFVLSDLNDSYRACFEEYRRRLEENGFPTVRTWPYAYGSFEDGSPISDILRICLRAHDPDGLRWPDPYDASSQGFLAWATTPGVASEGHYLSPYAVTLHRVRRDLQEAFPRPLAEDEEAYARWFVGQRGSSTIFHPVYVEPIAQALDRPSQRAEEPPPAGGWMERMVATARYYASYPVRVAPYIPRAAIDVIPDVYTGPEGPYGWIRRVLLRRGILQPVRKLLGLRTILTVRYFFSYPQRSEGSSTSVSAPAHDLGGPAREVERAVAVAPGRAMSSVDGTVTPPTMSGSRGANIIGFVDAETGVGEVARKLLHCLDAVGCPVSRLPIEAFDTSRHEDKGTDRFAHGVPHQINIFNVNADLTFPVRDHLGPGIYEGRHNIGYWFWEIAEFPERWQAAFDVYDEIWVASSFAQATVAHRAPIPVVRVPIAIDVALPIGATRESLRLPEDGFIALYVFDALSVVERKNPWAAIRAFERAFTQEERRDKARLVMKVTNLERFPQEALQLREAMRRVDGILIEGYLGRPETNALISHCDAYLSLHRSEGFGLTIAEAMYLGKPVIATAYSGNMDLMTADNCYQVPYRLVELERDYPPYDRGNVWAEPDCEAAAEMLRDVFANPDDARGRGLLASASIRRDNNYSSVGKRIAERLALIADRSR